MNGREVFLKYEGLADLKALPHCELQNFAYALREYVVEVVSKIGGHLGASLGVVELTCALHYVFNSPEDKLIWDVGHQAYPHKVLTGRKEALKNVRQLGGISGFTNIFESKHDAFGAGHSSTSISAGLGFGVAANLRREGYFTICIIGDGAMSAGLAFEALNNAGDFGGRLLIILNDNDMSISPPTGALSRYLPRLATSSELKFLKSAAKDALSSISTRLLGAVRTAEKSLKSALIGGNLFEEFGVNYIGPVNGHDVEELARLLERIRDVNLNEPAKPILLHVITQKGKGYKPAEESLDKYHGVTPFEVATGAQAKKATGVSYSKFASETLCELAKGEPLLCAITPAMKAGSCLENFAEQFPSRFFDVGIAEQHAATFAAGMAAGGLKPYCFIYSTFLQRAYDQVIHDVCLQNLPVRFIVDRAGLVGEDGPTHHGVFDIAYLRILPNAVIISPSGREEMRKALEFSASFSAHPLFLRFPRGVAHPGASGVFEFGKANVVQEGWEVAILTVGSMLFNVLETDFGFTPAIIDLRFLKPLDEALLLEVFARYKKVVLVEEGCTGGVYSSILELLHKNGLEARNFKAITLPDEFIEHAGLHQLQERFALKTEKLRRAVIDFLS